jgi:hypothetical protein
MVTHDMKFLFELAKDLFSIQPYIQMYRLLHDPRNIPPS